jgi:hypothetical protein
MKTNKIRFDIVEIENLVSWLNSLEGEERKRFISGNSIVEIESVQTRVGEKHKATILKFCKSIGWTKSNIQKNISNFEKW